MTARFQPGWKATLFVLLFLPALLALGTWQVSRGAEKRALESAYLDRLTRLPVPVQQMEPHAAFQRVWLDGHFTEQAYLVDNQVYKGRTGYWLVQVFEHNTGARYLLNRGFVAGAADRQRLPDVDQPGPVRVIGSVWPFLGLIPLLDDDDWPQQWPKRVQRLNVARMAAQTSAMAVEIRLEPGQPGVQQAAPFASVLSDAKHRGYAATWYGLAVVLLLGYIVFGLRGHR